MGTTQKLIRFLLCLLLMYTLSFSTWIVVDQYYFSALAHSSSTFLSSLEPRRLNITHVEIKEGRIDYHSKIFVNPTLNLTVSVNASSIGFTQVIFFTLMLATPFISIRRRLISLLLGALILYFSHICYAIADYLTVGTSHVGKPLFRSEFYNIWMMKTVVLYQCTLGSWYALYRVWPILTWLLFVLGPMLRALKFKKINIAHPRIH